MTNDRPTWIDIDPTPERPPHPNPIYVGPAMWEWLAANGYDMYQYKIVGMMPVDCGDKASIFTVNEAHSAVFNKRVPFYRQLPYQSKAKRNRKK